jgi:hypothetical protein
MYIFQKWMFFLLFSRNCMKNLKTDIPSLRLMTHFTPPKMTYFDLLPLEDVIHETIIHMLDYESRIQFNQFLLPFERLPPRRLTQKECIQHEISVQILLIKSQLDFIGDSKSTKLKKSQRLCSFISNLGKRGCIVSYYFHRFRDAIIDKFTNILDPTSDTIQGASPYFKKKLRRVVEELLPKYRLIETRANDYIPRTITIREF